MLLDLLFLARCHAGVERVRRRPFRLRELVALSWSQLLARGPEVRLELHVPEDLVVESDPGKLAIVFSNLLDNAVSHGRPEGPTRCTATAKDGTFAVEIANPADPLGEKETRSLAEPFWRKDGAGTADAHSGLGLSLVAALAKLLDLEIDFRQDAGTFRVLLRAALPQGRPKVSQKFPEEHSLAIARRQRRQKP